MANFPTDQFDHLPDDLDRVGAHRGPKVRGRGWLGLLWAVLAVVVLTLAGIFGLQVLTNSDNDISGGGGTGSTSTPTPTPTQQSITDGNTVRGQKITVTVLNGTATTGLANKAATKLKSFHWRIDSIANASVTDFKKTVVYYSNAKYKAEAIGIAADLGFTQTALTTNYGKQPITVVVGGDYKG